MSLRAARALTAVYFVLMLVFVTWPGLVPFARVRPLVLGLPFSMAWIAAWIAGSVVVLQLLDGVERRYREAGDPRADPSAGRPAADGGGHRTPGGGRHRAPGGGGAGAADGGGHGGVGDGASGRAD